MKELTLDRTQKRGDRNNTVKVIQEWLSLHGFTLTMDKDFGPATESMIKQFQKKMRLPETGIVNKTTFARLTLPMSNALKPLPVNSRTISNLVVAYAKQHLRQHPREIGGQNRGPWVRLYMKGSEGNAFPWCAGFATYLVRQACDTLKISMPINSTVSCDRLAGDAKKKKRFLDGRTNLDKSRIKPGSLFLNKKSEGDWVHTGIVTKASQEHFETIEGNTNDEGSREGYEVCKRARGYGKKDFVIVGDLSIPKPKPKPKAKAKTKTPLSKKEQLKWLQRSLNTLIGSRLVVDGIPGRKTTQAIKRFQARHGLTADGIAGARTKRKIRILLGNR